ncbi:MAG: hypothetical protein HRU20_15715 [Pseudomonadales bacterium]|nr:hypothetical protein [Pseudomonadales bacterium]
MMDINKLIADQQSIYLNNFIENKDSSEGTFQNNRATQYLRFEKILEPFLSILNQQVSFHDVGCGSCDMYQYMLDNAIVCDYSGTEIIDEMVEYAGHRFPGINVKNQNVLDVEFKDRFDILVFSGGLYYPGNIDHVEWKVFVFQMIDKMYSQCDIGISFNLLTTYKNMHRDDLFYLDPREIIDYVATRHSRFFNLNHNYPLYEWTISIFKPEYIESVNQAPEYEKYFK